MFFLAVVRATSVPSCFCFLTCHLTSIIHPSVWRCERVCYTFFFTPLPLCPGGRACADPAFGRRECTWQELADASSRGSRQQGSALCWASDPTVEQCERVRPRRTNCPAPRRSQRTHPGIIETHYEYTHVLYFLMFTMLVWLYGSTVCRTVCKKWVQMCAPS